MKKLLPLDKLNNIYFLSITLLAVLRIFLFPQIWSLVTRPFFFFFLLHLFMYVMLRHRCSSAVNEKLVTVTVDSLRGMITLIC